MTTQSISAIDLLHTPKTQIVAAKPRRKLRGGAIASSLLGRVLHPGHLVRAAKLQLKRKAHRHTFDDAQLALYSQIMPSDFLHYGYFDDAGVLPEEISISDVTRAQGRYAELILDLAGDPADPVLDVGCGMGGLCRMLKARHYVPTALTPDRLQAAHLQSTQSDVPVIRCKFEQLKVEDYQAKFGTVITAESLQYLKLDKALPAMAAILKPGGRWVACDYFHVRPSEDRSCHVWDDFAAKLTASGWRITHQQNITPHILPTLRYVHMWATRFGIPLMKFGFLRLRRKQPGLHHLLGGIFEQLEGLAAGNIELIDPAKFAANKRYMLLAMERA
jgi:cyclopropane fatty-acyl-phospholipid synthase-like methyltransferase